MSDDIKPALTAEQWETKSTQGSVRVGEETGDAFLLPRRLNDGTQIGIYMDDGKFIGLLNVHGTAALCLYQQPFGFTQEDVDLLRGEAAGYEGAWNVEASATALRLRSLAARVAALLPPETP